MFRRSRARRPRSAARPRLGRGSADRIVSALVEKNEPSILVLDERLAAPVALFDLLDLFLAQSKVVPDLVNERLTNDGADFILVFAAFLDRSLKERDAIGELIPVLPRAFGERRSLIQAVQRIGRLDLHLIEQLEAWLVLDNQGEVVDLFAEALRDQRDSFNEQTFER